MKKIIILLIVTALTFIHQVSTYASINLESNQRDQYLVDQAQFLIQNGISQQEVLEIFKDGLKKEKLCADKPKSNKILWTIAGCCVVLVVIGGTYYFLVKKQTQNAPPQQQPTPNQPAQQNQQEDPIQHAPQRIPPPEIDLPRPGPDAQHCGELLNQFDAVMQPGEDVHNSLIRLMHEQPERLNQTPLLAEVVEQLRRAERQPGEDQNDFITRVAPNIPGLGVVLLIRS